MDCSIAIRNGVVYNAQGEARIADIGIAGNRICSVGEKVSAKQEIDAGAMMVLPGFVDIHMHGIGFNAVKDGSLAEVAKIEAEHGASSFVATLFGPPEESIDNLRRHLKDTDDLHATPQVAGFRLESPYLGYTGGGVSSDLAPISRKLTDALFEAGKQHIRIWDISPEIENAVEEIDYISSRGTVCSLAHTRASIETAMNAVDAGARLVTHMFDTFVLPVMTDPGVYPAALTDYLLLEDRVSCEIIGDGTHVHPLLVEKTFRCKGPDRVIFVTDSNLGAGLPDGDYDLPGGWGRARVAGQNKGVRLIDRDMGLAGSALTPVGSFRNAVGMFDRSIAEACRLCSLNPAKLLGLNKGVIAPGYDADIVVLDTDFEVVLTVSSGEIVYCRKAAC